MLKPVIAILSLFFAAATTEVIRSRCDGTNINNLYYKRELLASIDGYATNLAIDSKTDNIYFVLHKKNYTKGIHLLKHASLGIKELPVSDDLVGQCVVVDDFNNIIYIGTNQGLLTYDDTKSVISAERPLGDDDIRYMFVDTQDNQLFITTGANHEVYRFVNGSAAVKRYERVPKAYSIVVDKKGNAFYEYIDGRMYSFPADLFEPVQYKGFSRELKYILKLNKRDEVIVAVKGSLFKLTTKTMLPKKIGQLGFKITGLTFDMKNNMIVGTKGKIYRYTEIGEQDPCPSEDYFMSSI